MLLGNAALDTFNVFRFEIVPLKLAHRFSKITELILLKRRETVVLFIGYIAKFTIIVFESNR